MTIKLTIRAPAGVTVQQVLGTEPPKLTLVAIVIDINMVRVYCLGFRV